ncbi:MAG: porin, partial [Acidobacteriota bacterium]
IVPVNLAGKTSFYLSCTYSKGQVDTDYTHGEFYRPVFGMIFSEEITSNVDFLGEFHLQGNDSFSLDRAWMRFKPSIIFEFRLGLYLVPFGIYNELFRAHETALIHRPLNLEYTYPERWRDLGIGIQGLWGGLRYAVYAGNGLAEESTLSQGQQWADNNANKGIGGQITWQLEENFEVGYSRYQGKYDDGNLRWIHLQGFHFSWVTSSFSLLAEYSGAKIENPEEFLTGELDGYFVQATLNWGGLTPVLSYQKVTYTDPFHGKGFAGEDLPGEGTNISKNRWALGAVYAIDRVLFLKFEYDWNTDLNADLEEDRFSFQIAVLF